MSTTTSPPPVFYHFDVERFPLIVLTIQGSPSSVQEMDNFLQMWQDLYVRAMQENSQYKLLFDIRQAVFGENAIFYMKYMAQWLTKMRPLAEKWMDRTAIICQKSYVKTFLYILFRLYPPAKPYKIFQEFELEDAMTWIFSSQEGEVIKLENVNEKELKESSEMLQSLK